MISRSRPGPNPSPALKHRTAVVCTKTRVQVIDKQIQVGAERIGETVQLNIDGATVMIFDSCGELLRTVQTKPNILYYGNGKPRGRPRKPRPVDQLQTGAGTAHLSGAGRACRKHMPQGRRGSGVKGAAIAQRPLTPEGRAPHPARCPHPFGGAGTQIKPTVRNTLRHQDCPSEPET